MVTSPYAPLRVRQALNVEAGLNDGLSVPFLLFFIALAAASEESARASFAQFVVEQLGYGVAVGAVIGLAGGWLLGAAARRDWISGPFKQCGVVALPLLCLLVSDAVAASMFIAAFVAGLAVQKGFPDAGRHSLEFGEIWGQIINLSVFFLFFSVQFGVLSILEEREGGTLDRILMAPIAKSAVMVGKMMSSLVISKFLTSVRVSR